MSWIVSCCADTRVFHFGSLSLTDEPARSALAGGQDFARPPVR